MTLKINIDGVVRRLTLYVTDKRIMNVDVLIGQNITELDDVCYEKSNGVLKFMINRSLN